MQTKTKSNKSETARPDINWAGATPPRIDLYGPGNTEKAELLFGLLDDYGIRLYLWQKGVLRRWLAEDKDGRFVNLSCGLSVPRQNGKTEIIVARIVYGIIFRAGVGLFTAQKQKTVDVVRRRVQDFFYENESEEIFNLLTPRFRKKPRNFDFLEFENGARFQFITRTRLGGLGMTVDDLINDEAADMLDSHQATLIPTISAAETRNPQVCYCGTPPMAESVGEVFSRVRKELLAGAPGCWTEWSVERMAEREDRDAWQATNPSLGKCLLETAVEAEARSLSQDDFNRMRLGWWSGVEDKRAIRQKEWEACACKKPEFDEDYLPTFAVKFSPDRSDWSLAAAQPLKGGKTHVEIVMQRPMSEGMTKLSRWLLERWRNAARIVIDGATGQALLFEDLTSGGVPPKKIVQPSMKEIVAAHQFMYDGIMQEEFSHYDQPLLNQTVRIAKQRPLGRYGGFGWESMTKNLSTCALDAATFAYWAQKVFPKKVPRVESGDDRWREVLSNL